MVSPPAAAGVASTPADAVAAAPSITATVTGALDNAANWLSGRPAESAAAFLQGALLLVRRNLFGGPATAPAAATVPVLVDDNLPIVVSPTNSFKTIYGTTAAGSVTVNGHTWVADPKTHLYTTTADLAEEWQAYYSEMQAGRGAELNDVQRLAGNAQAVFENTDLKFQTPDQLSVDRQDVQKVLDAVYAAMIGAGVDPSSTLTEDQYLAIGAVLQNNPTLRELAVQGHGLNNAWIPRYAGFTRHFQNNVDGQTRYIGPGFNSGQRALADFFDDNIITHLPFPTVVHNGVLWQLNQNGNREATVADSVAALNESLTTTYTSDDFRQPPALVNKTPNQALEPGQPFNFALADDTFVDPQGEDITYTATRIFGIPLPKWLSFDAQTGEFSGTAPVWRIALVFVKATNSSGISRTEAFFVHTK
ncbi:MAG: putative Ig domain-containing protein [Mycobacterium sp.]|nr:putative Ig domain-containing protein [Mycobacterium sp.]